MTIDFTMARVLKAYPGAAARYQGESTEVPVLLQPVGVDPVAFQAYASTYVAALASVQLGSRLTLVLPWMTAVNAASAAPETAYRYRPFWRLRTPAVGGHLPPTAVAGDTIPNPNASPVVAWSGDEIVPTVPPDTLRPLLPPGYNPDLFTLSNGDLQPGGTFTPNYLAPFSRYDLDAEGDEFGLLVQPVGPARPWDFAQGAADANFAARYMENPYPPLGYLKQIGAFILTGERSP